MNALSRSLEADHSTKSLRRDPTTLRSLVLNADARPLGTYPLSLISAQDAISAVWRDRATVVETWDDAFFHSPSTTIPVPKTLMLRDYAHVTGDPKFCRRSVLLRDKMCCQYCGQQFQSHELTFDHVVPRVQGGRTEWTNIVASCIPCNALKADRSANHSGRKGVKGSLRPLKMPRRPTNMELLMAGLQFLPNDVLDDWRSWLHWQVELRQ